MSTRPSCSSFNFLLCSLITITLLSCIKAPWPEELLLQHSLTIGFIVTWFFIQKKYPLSLRSTSLITVFILLHIFGARWLYSNVPYDTWLRACCSTDTQQLFGWTRNHYDRMVHLAYGLCFSLPLAEIFQRQGHKKTSSWHLALLWIMASSLCYEWFEWGVSIILSAQEAEGYNGQQGDIWDAHKDMLLASIGALLSCLFWRNQSQR
ncbi:DUF2238 domain-containing protein [Deefgea piscis]|uniref:DUF2238 domain-containing protein n=1 Tax=Deefgea piscis TaxID=2739061 RepID=A0A6M8SUW5_9NEIS|nr:DUF2238 domain-containing protein [Deefgea piscis]QKJ67858.1 DUF2238 domain-containing protein [Deefgea piscis]